MQGFLRVTELARFGLRFQSCKILGNWDFAQPWFANIVVTYYLILISRAHLLHRVKEPSKVLREQPPSSPDDQEPGPVSTTDHWTNKDDLLSSSSIEEEPLGPVGYTLGQELPTWCWQHQESTPTELSQTLRDVWDKEVEEITCELEPPPPATGDVNTPSWEN